MSAHAIPHPRAVRLHPEMTGAMVNAMIVGGGALAAFGGLSRGHLILIAGLLTTTLGMIAGKARRQYVTSGTLVAGPAALLPTIVIAATWPLVWPGERLTTVAIVAAASIACTVVIAVSQRARRPVGQ